MNYNEIGKYLEKQFGGTEFFVYSAKDVKKLLTGSEPNVGTRIMKTCANMWVAF